MNRKQREYIKIHNWGKRFNRQTRDKIAEKGLRVEDILKELELKNERRI